MWPEIQSGFRVLSVRLRLAFSKVSYSWVDLVLAGLKGKSNKRLIPIAEVKQHCTEEDAWTVLRGCVYNISPYIRFHPGGSTTCTLFSSSFLHTD